MTLVFWCAAVFAFSVGGGALPGLLRMNHVRMQTALSFVAGLMLAIALLHMIPHASDEAGGADHIMLAVLAGFLVLFFLQRVFHYHTHETEDAGGGCACGGGGKCGHTEPAKGSTAWVGAAAGLSLHSLLDGVAMAAALHAGPEAGFGTALAVLLHKPFDALAVTTLMRQAGSGRTASRVVNLLFALVAPAGALAFGFGFGETLESSSRLVPLALAFCAGGFLCISASDLLPELHFHSHDRWRLSLALLAGIAVAWAVGLCEAHEHAQEHGHEHVPAHNHPTGAEHGDHHQ